MTQSLEDLINSFDGFGVNKAKQLGTDHRLIPLGSTRSDTHRRQLVEMATISIILSVRSHRPRR